MSQFAILRIEKIKALAGVSGWAGHALRANPTPNADPARASENRLLAFDGAPVRASEVRSVSVDEVTAAARRRLDQATHKMARSVQALDVFMGVSPEWAASATPDQWRAWRSSCLTWLRDEFGAANVIAAQWHGDETTPHITALVTPIRADGRLSAAHWMGGEDKRGQRLSEMQDRHHAAVSAVGLERGIKGSKAKHQRVARFYGAATQPPPPAPKIGAPSRLDMLKPGGPEAFAEEQTARVKKAVRRMADKASSAEIERTRAEGAEATARAQEKRLERMREQTADLRQLPLDEVLRKWRLEPFKNSKKVKEQQWADPKPKGSEAEHKHRITFRTSDGAAVWHDHVKKRGGRGAIDLVMHLEGCTPSEAIAALAARFGRDAAVRATVADAAAKARAAAEQLAAKPPPPFKPPLPCPEYWPSARQWLMEERGIPGPLVDEAHARGDLYADERRNLVALQRSPEGEVVGAEVRGTRATPFSGVSIGSRPTEGLWQLPVAVDTAAPNLGAAPLVLAESCVDALSIAAIRGPDRPAIYASTGGNSGASPDHPVVTAAVEAGRQVVAAVDSDRQGQAYLAAYLERWGERIQKALPALKDWNDQLRERIRGGWRSLWEARRGQEGGEAAPTPTLEASEAPAPP